MPKPQWKRSADALTTTTPNGTARISRTIPVEGVSAGPWTLHIDGQFQDTFDTDAEAITHAEEILSRPK
jgi:hypothetical protein